LVRAGEHLRPNYGHRPNFPVPNHGAFSFNATAPRGCFNELRAGKGSILIAAAS